MATKKSSNGKINDQDISHATEVLGKLILQSKYAHMKTHVQGIIGGLLLPYLVDIGSIDEDDQVKVLMEAYAKEKIKELLNPDPITIPIEQIVERIRYARPVFRRIKTEVKKVKRMERELCSADRDILIRWWNVNQRLVTKEDPVCPTLADQCNAATKSNEPICAMQVAGYFSHLCRIGLRTDTERTKIFERSIKRGAHTITPRYSFSLQDAILKNWEKERANEAARGIEQEELRTRRAQGIRTPVIANII